MKILKEGKIPVIKSKCPICGCEFEFTPDEASNIEIKEHIDMFGTLTINLVKYEVKCPCCEKLINSD